VAWKLIFLFRVRKTAEREGPMCEIGKDREGQRQVEGDGQSPFVGTTHQL